MSRSAPAIEEKVNYSKAVNKKNRSTNIFKIDLVLGHNSFNIKIKTKQDIFVRRFDASSIMFTVRW